MRSSRLPPLTRLARRAARVRADLTLAVFDAVLAGMALAVVLSLRRQGVVTEDHWQGFLFFAPIAAATTVTVNWVWDLYGQMWRHASVLEARRIALAGLTTGGLLTALAALGPRLVPLSVIVLGTATATMGSGALRFQSRLFAVHRRIDEPSGLRVAVIGAGETGAALVRDMLRRERDGLVPVAILDDDPRTHGRACLGVRVVGAVSDLPEVAVERAVHQVVLAIPSASRELVRRAADLADQAGLPLRVLPDVVDLVDRQATVRDLRDLQIEDLLGREQVCTDYESVRALLRGRRVLITGAGGSIGSEIARQVSAFEPGALLLLDHDETHLHDVCSTIPGPATQLLADIRERTVVARLFDQHRPEVVFHAAAHKHVPVLESHPAEAVRTNALGTANVVAAANAVGVERLVFISTDKAVRPSSVMGASKRLGEQIVLAGRPEGARYCAVRFGNVLGSRGSVIPTFLRQIDSGEPVTITDARMTRFFMSIREAVQLVLQSAALVRGGEVFVLEMGDPVRIFDLAQRMIRLAGRRVGSDVEIRVVGMRPGEKLVEELHEPDEELRATEHPSIHKIEPGPVDAAEVDEALDRLSWFADQGDEAALRDSLFRLAGGRSVIVLPSQRPEPGPVHQISLPDRPWSLNLTTERRGWSPSHT
jgi:FlaA1/EpsC-like NDP-sugar epimerase